ncbi:MAG: transglycosylase domain-containing protein [Bacteroidales bacterium]
MKRWVRVIIGACAVLIISVLLAPMPSFDKPLSTVVEAADGSLLGARVADDGQWRFPPPDSLPDKYVTCLINYEDRWFRWHPGVNPVAVIKALAGNIRAGKTVRGGSTITMQVARLARGNPERTYSGKIIEMLSALKLELLRSKRKILLLYAANAPFGGNTVGLEAAAWRYTGRNSNDLTWAEAATLAVLPNAPSLIYPGRRSGRLQEKRDGLLTLLAKRKIIDSLTCSLAIGEPLPDVALPMPSLAPHLTSRLWIDNPGRRIKTTIDPALQREVSALVNSHQEALEGNLIYNAAALIVEVSGGNVLAYAGNSTLPDTEGLYGRDVDMIPSARSTGSIMKPFLYAGLLTGGEILPNALVPDIPTRFPGFRPENSDFTYSGAVPAGDALARSLNIPAVRMLQMMNEERFLNLLHRMGFTSFDKPASHYGLSLILGGGEASLWELAGAYASMARVLNNMNAGEGYNADDWHMPVLTTHQSPSQTTVGSDTLNPKSQIANHKSESSSLTTHTSQSVLSAPAIWLTYEALRRVNRPETETGWRYFGSSPDIAWKTGTSFGFRDAWAIGTTPSYVVAVWAGNADGEGRPGLSGISSAAPLLFDIFRLLEPGGWFARPEEGMTLTEVCAASGFRAGPDCNEKREEWIPSAGLKSDACPYHTVINLDTTGRYRVNISCAQPGGMVRSSWFVLPPAMEYYYRMRNPAYRTLPPFRPGCTDDRQVPSMEFLYPPRDAKIFIPRSLQGQLMSMLPEIAHRQRNAVIYWHLDNRYIGMTKHIHQIELQVNEGEHVITATDNEGLTISRKFICVGSL